MRASQFFGGGSSGDAAFAAGMFAAAAGFAAAGTFVAYSRFLEDLKHRRPTPLRPSRAVARLEATKEREAREAAARGASPGDCIDDARLREDAEVDATVGEGDFSGDAVLSSLSGKARPGNRFVPGRGRVLAPGVDVPSAEERASGSGASCNLTEEDLRGVAKDIVLVTPETPEGIAKQLSRQTIIPDADRERYETKAGALWDRFYHRNENRFYKDRHYIRDVWGSYLLRPDVETVMLEVGCGAGNTIFPLLRANPRLVAHACDFSKKAVRLVAERPEFPALAAEGRASVFQCDITDPDTLAANIEADSIDVLTCIFVLSALKPDTVPGALDNLARCVKDGGHILVREYARHDQAQLRYSKRLSDNYYVRQADGTLAYFFELGELAGLMDAAGFDVAEERYETRNIVNRKKGIAMKRKWIHAVYRKRGKGPDSVADQGASATSHS